MVHVATENDVLVLQLGIAPLQDPHGVRHVETAHVLNDRVESDLEVRHIDESRITACPGHDAGELDAMGGQKGLQAALPDGEHGKSSP